VGDVLGGTTPCGAPARAVPRPGSRGAGRALPHHREKGLVNPLAAFQQRREERPVAQLQDPLFRFLADSSRHMTGL
jgi:hypothetical protein